MNKRAENLTPEELAKLANQIFNAGQIIFDMSKLQ